MIQFIPITDKDKIRIWDWILKDPFHNSNAKASDPDWWVTGSDCLVASRIDDETGSILYFRIDKVERERARLHVQFAPAREVGKARVVRSISQAMPILKIMASNEGAKGFEFESVSPLLIRFMKSFGFKPSLNKADDYVWVWG